MAGQTRFKNSYVKDKDGGTLTANPKQNAISDLNLTASDSYVQAELQAVADKVDAILAALRAANIIAE